MTDIVFVFEVHQPHRLKRNLFWENRVFRRLKKEELFGYYFDNDVDRQIFKRAAGKCYFPSNQILLALIDEYRKEKRQVKVSFSVSGVFLEQCEMFEKDLLETFRQLAETGCVEFLNQTYYHSIASLYSEKDEFIEQVKMHRQTVKSLLGCVPIVFENTELLYNNTIAGIAEDLGYKGIFMEGVEKILGEKSPNYLYTPKGCKNIRVLLRNYKLTDDIGFRFSSHRWPGYPLTADKYAGWMSQIDGDLVNLFMDYETFGEHQWTETGIFDFLEHLPDNILKHNHLDFVTVSEAVDKYNSMGEIDVPWAISWADEDRNVSTWLGNDMQIACFNELKNIGKKLKKTGNQNLINTWRKLQTSDHLYYVSTKGFKDGAVHAYFSHYDNPYDGFINYMNILQDLKHKI